MAATETVNSSALTVRRVIPASREAIFRAWTDPAQLKLWFAPDETVSVISVDADARTGGSYRLTLIGPQKVPFSVAGTYREVQPFDKLVFTWIWEDPDMDVGETVVTIQLNQQGAETELVLTHELFPSTDGRDNHEKGWAAILGRLAAYIGK